jgi:hypothetical protein
VRIFLSFNSRDTDLAEAARAGLSRIEPKAQIFFSSVSLGAGFWLPKLAEESARALDALKRFGSVTVPNPFYEYACCQVRVSQGFGQSYGVIHSTISRV